MFNLIYISLFILFIFIINKFIVITNIRYKFLLLIVIMFIIASIGLYYDLDGLVMLFLISELSIILIFITIFSQIYTLNTEISNISSIKLISLIMIFLNYNFYSIDIVDYTNFYSNYSINTNDFYFIYNYYFEKQILVMVFSILIITIFSIFFILLYFSLKSSQLKESKKKKNLNLLRKQNIIHQSNYSAKIRIFNN
jgi:hypothetical protein